MRLFCFMLMVDISVKLTDITDYFNERIYCNEGWVVTISELDHQV